MTCDDMCTATISKLKQCLKALETQALTWYSPLPVNYNIPKHKTNKIKLKEEQKCYIGLSFKQASVNHYSFGCIICEIAIRFACWLSW